MQLLIFDDPKYAIGHCIRPRPQLDAEFPAYLSAVQHAVSGPLRQRRIINCPYRGERRHVPTARLSLVKYFLSQPVPGGFPSAAEMVDAGTAAAIENDRRDMEKRSGEIVRRRRTPMLIVDDPHSRAVARQPEHGDQEVRAEHAVQPRRPKNHRFGMGAQDRLFTFEL